MIRIADKKLKFHRRPINLWALLGLEAPVFYFYCGLLGETRRLRHMSARVTQSRTRLHRGGLCGLSRVLISFVYMVRRGGTELLDLTLKKRMFRKRW